MKQYLYIENNQVVVNPELKPKKEDYAPVLCFTKGEIDRIEYNVALSAWQKNCKPVENEYKVSDIDVVDGKITTKKAVNINGHIHFVAAGMLCETTETEPYRVTEIY